jgi:glyoxylase I family protein
MFGMNLEHIGLNHPDAVAAAAWYEQNLGMKIARKFGPPGNGHFLADTRGQMMVEFYHNALAPVPDFRAMNPMSFHIAFYVDDVNLTRERLIKAGATAQGNVTSNDDGDQLAMVRDPWGLPVQIVKRATPML